MFRKLFGGSPDADMEKFRARVLKLVRKWHPDVSFQAPGDDADIIYTNEAQIGLKNLHTKFEQSNRTEETFEALVRDHFQFVLQREPTVPEFAEARARLRPQIMPAEYSLQAPVLSFPFGQTLAIGIVLDAERGYAYLREEDATRWNKSAQELLDIAIANLDEASRDMAMHASDGGDDKWVGIETKDGFDAARILLPNLRAFFESRLGSPFRFAVPNRDFLICWNTGASPNFAGFAGAKVQDDFKTQPYPLSPGFFEVTADGTITEHAF